MTSQDIREECKRHFVGSPWRRWLRRLRYAGLVWVIVLICVMCPQAACAYVRHLWRTRPL